MWSIFSDFVLKNREELVARPCQAKSFSGSAFRWLDSFKLNHDSLPAYVVLLHTSMRSHMLSIPSAECTHLLAAPCFGQYSASPLRPCSTRPSFPSNSTHSKLPCFHASVRSWVHLHHGSWYLPSFIIWHSRFLRWIMGPRKETFWAYNRKSLIWKLVKSKFLPISEPWQLTFLHSVGAVAIYKSEEIQILCLGRNL